jgi:phage gp46-like protein
MPLQVFDLKTAVSLSLLTDKRADEHELPFHEVYKRGWWGDCLNTSGNKIGSKLWLLHRRKFDREAIDLAKNYTTEALDWLIQDEIADEIDVQCEVSDQKILLIDVTVHLTNGEAPVRFWIQFPKNRIFYAL